MNQYSDTLQLVHEGLTSLSPEVFEQKLNNNCRVLLRWNKSMKSEAALEWPLKVPLSPKYHETMYKHWPAQRTWYFTLSHSLMLCERISGPLFWK